LSFDFFILKPRPDTGLVGSLDGVQETFPLGAPEEIKRQCDLAISGISWSANSGLYQAKEGFVIEFSIPNEGNPLSRHLTLHFGSSWEEAGSAAFDRLIQKLYELLRWQSFAASDNSSLLISRAD
jgi:hypothetical protein